MIEKRYIHETFKEFVKQCSSDTGVVISVDGFPTNYGIKMNFKINGKRKLNNNQYPLLNIPNYEDFLSHLSILFNKFYDQGVRDKTYYGIDDESYMMYIMMCIFVNMSSIDFNAPINYFDRINESLNQDYGLHNKIYIGNMLIKGENLKIFKEVRRNMISMETLQHVLFTLENDKGEVYSFPKIHYYLENNHAYILGIQRMKHVDETSFTKKVDRYLRKMDKGIEEEQSKDGNVNNIKDISVSALGALTLFNSYYDNIENIYMIDYLPLRYMNKIRNENKAILEEVNDIYKNVVDKFLMTGVRLCEHFNHLDCGLEYNMLDIEVNKYEHQEGNIIYDLYEGVNNKYQDLKDNVKR